MEGRVRLLLFPVGHIRQLVRYDVAASADGLDLRFTAGDGSESVGRYIDLK